MKKVSAMNAIEKIAYKNIKGVFQYEVGGWYNCIMDHCEEYIPDTMEQAKQIVYEESLTDYAEQGIYRCGKAPKEMRFAGAEFIWECINHLFATDEDAKEIAEEKGWK